MTPSLLAYLEAIGFSPKGYGTDKDLDRKQIEDGFVELDRFLRLASMPVLRYERMMVCTYLDRNFWHPMIGFLEEYHPYGYRGFCTEYYGCEIPHEEGSPDRHAFLFTIDMMQKVYGSRLTAIEYWHPFAELPDCTKSPVPLH